MLVDSVSCRGCAWCFIHRWWFPLVGAFFFAAIARPAAAEETLDDILRLWEERRAKIESLHCEWYAEGYRVGEAGLSRLFGRAKQTTTTEDSPPVHSHRGAVTFRISGSKFFASIEREPTGPELSFPGNIQREVFAFDGSTNRELSLSPLLHTGEIHPSNAVDWRFTNRRDFAGLWMAIEPLSYVGRLGFVPSQMTIRNRWTNADGEEIVEVVVPGHNPERRMTIQLDRSRKYLPIDAREDRNEELRSSLSLTYAPNEEIGWSLQEWEDHLFDQSANPSLSRRCQVVRFDVNTPVPDYSFTIDFPEGTHVVRYAGPARAGDEEYFIAGEDDELTSIPRSQYRRIDVDADMPSRTNRWPLALITTLVVVFAVTAIYAYNRRKVKESNSRD